ncbi:MAG: TolC family protein [Bacteroidota bacterium]
MKKLICTVAALLFFLGLSAQIPETLTLEEAISLALENNTELKISQKQVDIAQNDLYAGNAGLLPTISLIGNASYQNNNTDALIRTFQETPPTVAISDGAAATTTYSAVVQADYILLGGFSGKYRYQLLKDQKDMTYFQQQLIINQTIVAVSEIFLEIVKLQSQEDLLDKNVKIGEARVQRVADQFQFGKVTGLAVLRSKTDLNLDKTALSNVQVASNNLKRDLNFLLGIEANAGYRVSVNYQLPAPGEILDLRNEVLANNYEIQLVHKGEEMANTQYQLNTANRLPTVNAFANYGYFNQQNDFQQLAEVETLGYTVGVGFRYNIFSGGRNNRNIQKAKLNQDISEFRKKQTEDRILSEAVKEQNNLSLLQDQLQRENENIEAFRENYSRTEERGFTMVK